MEKHAIRDFRNTCVKAFDMLAVRFDLEMVEEVNHMIQPEIQHLLTLATQWGKDNNGRKVSLKNLLKMKIVGRTIKSADFKPDKMFQTKIPSFFQKNAKRDLPDSTQNQVVPAKKTKSAPSVAEKATSAPVLSVVEPDSDFSEEMYLNRNIDSNDTIRNSQLENTGASPAKNALVSSSEESSESDASDSEAEERSDTNMDGESVNAGDDNDNLSSSRIREQVIDVLDSEVGRAVIDSVS